MTPDNPPTPLDDDDDEFEEFVSTAVEDPWEAERIDDDPLHDISITHPERSREILIDSARNRVSYRDDEKDMWGLQQKPVADLERAVKRLRTVALFVPMSETQYIGLGSHPDPPSDMEEPDGESFEPDEFCRGP